MQSGPNQSREQITAQLTATIHSFVQAMNNDELDPNLPVWRDNFARSYRATPDPTVPTGEDGALSLGEYLEALRFNNQDGSMRGHVDSVQVDCIGERRAKVYMSLEIAGWRERETKVKSFSVLEFVWGANEDDCSREWKEGRWLCVRSKDFILSGMVPDS